MTLAVTLKRKADKEELFTYLQEDIVIQFFQDLKKYKFASLGGRLIFGELEQIDIFKISSINYDYFDPKEKIFLVTLEHEDGSLEIVRSDEVDENFEPKSQDITTDFILEYYLNKKASVNNTIEKITYDPKNQELLIGNKEIFIGGTTTYMILVKWFIESGKDSVFISELSEFHHNMDIVGELEEKKTRNGLSYFHKITKELTGGKRIFRSDGAGKVFYNIPIVVKNCSESD